MMFRGFSRPGPDTSSLGEYCPPLLPFFGLFATFCMPGWGRCDPPKRQKPVALIHKGVLDIARLDQNSIEFIENWMESHV